MISSWLCCWPQLRGGGGHCTVWSSSKCGLRPSQELLTGLACGKPIGPAPRVTLRELSTVIPGPGARAGVLSLRCRTSKGVCGKAILFGMCVFNPYPRLFSMNF